MLGALLASLALTGPADVLEEVRAWRDARWGTILSRYVELLRLPNVAADSENVRANARALKSAFEARGATMELLELEGAPPIVFGRLEAPGAERTLGIYVHYDGQPVVEDEWSFDPWTPTLTDEALENGGKPIALPADGDPIEPRWRLYGRASSDDKVPFPCLLTALDALVNAKIPLTSNLLFLFEGEEEAGSPHLPAYLERDGHRWEDVDLWLILDGPNHPSRRPQLMFGVRGITGLEVTLYGASRNLHSGHYGNWAPNPAERLARLLASMKGADGRVRIAGFYDDVLPLGPGERDALERLPEVDRGLREELRLATTEGDAPLAERLLLPSLNVRGFQSGAVGDKARNVIPNVARASLDIRLVRGNDPDTMLDLVEAHIRGQGFTIVREDPTDDERRTHAQLAKVVRQGGYPAARTSLDHPQAQPLIEAARLASGNEILLVPTLGGSLPLYLFTERLGKPIVIVPIANHDNNQHAPDENIRLGNLAYGIELMASILTMDLPQPR